MKKELNVMGRDYVSPSFEMIWLVSEAICLNSSDYGNTGSAGGYDSGDDLDYPDEF